MRNGRAKVRSFFYLYKKNMAKSKVEKVIASVELKDPNQIIHLKNVGLRITKDNLTVERYELLVSLSEEFSQYFNVKLTNKTNELEA